jgi:colanic acid biosynthesis glycosyl transferase WcaI
LGMLKTGAFTRALYWLERFAYRHATRVSGISQEILDAFRRKGVPERKLILFPNAVVLPAPGEFPERGIFRTKHGLSTNDFLAIYAGNLGVKQGLQLLVAAAKRLRGESNIRIIIAGDGAARETLEKQMRALGLTNLTMLPLQFGRDYMELLVDADVSLITQQSGSGNAFFPSKLLITLAYSSPVVTVADEGSALARAVEEGRFGSNVVPDKPELLADALREVARNRQQLREWGAAGRTYVERYEQGAVMAKFVEELKAIALWPRACGPS